MSADFKSDASTDSATWAYMGRGATYGSPSITQTETTKCLRPDRVGGAVVLLPAYNNPSLDLS